MSNELPDELISQYLTHDDTIKALRNEQASIKLKLEKALDIENTKETEWSFPGVGVASWVKGRVSKKLDPSMLIRCGVSAAKIEDWTTVSEGVPHLRVSRPKE